MIILHTRTKSENAINYFIAIQSAIIVLYNLLPYNVNKVGYLHISYYEQN